MLFRPWALDRNLLELVANKLGQGMAGDPIAPGVEVGVLQAVDVAVAISEGFDGAERREEVQVREPAFL